MPGHLIGDPGRLRQVLFNLAGNAVKFTRQGEVAVRAALDWQTESEVKLRFSVKDTGIGIPRDKQGLLFTKFTQADTSTTRRYGGTGLGLAISKQLAEIMGGEIGLISEEGHGSEFWFTARFGRQAAWDAIAAPAEIHGLRILVVDDNATNRDVLTTQLEAWGVRWAEAADGPAALRALHQASAFGDPFVAAILDMQMPGMDGEQLAGLVKADPTLSRTLLVLMTSLGTRGSSETLQALGFAACLTKPVRQSDLFDRLSTVLAGAAAGRPAPGESVSIVSAAESGDPRAPAAPPAEQPEFPNFGSRGGRILLAEDNVTNQQVALGILKKLGVQADAVANGAEVLAALESGPYDLVLMDVQMPEIDGLEATRRIRDPRSAVRNRAIPIIAMTAHALQGDRERCLEAGMDDYVTKPISAPSLRAALELWLPRQGIEAAAARPDPAAALTPPGASPAPPPASTVAPEPAPVFDHAGMMARLMGDEALGQVVVDGFLADIPHRIEALRLCLGAGDTIGALRHVHTIKGSSANVGGEALRAAAVAAEKAGRDDGLGAVGARMPEIEHQFARLAEAMRAFSYENGPEGERA